MSLAVPVGGVAGASGGALLGLITSPRLLVLLMGASAGAVAGKLFRGEAGEVAGQLAGGLLGGIAWATWLFFAKAKGPRL